MRLSDAEALRLLTEAPIHDLAERADAMRARMHPAGEVTYLIDRNINYTNICAADCLFCAFKRDVGDEKEGYVLDEETIAAKVREAKALGATSILLQGGLHPDLRMDYYERLVRFLRHDLDIHVHGFSAPEIHFLAKLERMTYEEVFERLIEAGLGSLPGGGAELLVDASRKKIAKGKCLTKEWVEVHRTAHRMGLRSTATMMFGTGEPGTGEPAEWIVAHLRVIRDLQDETGGFTAFIPWTMQPKNTRMAGTPSATAVEYLRVLALSRLYLDNVEHIQSSWVTQGDKVCQVGLRFGADDFGSLMIEENVVYEAGSRYRYSLDEILHNIRAAGFKPVRRTILYERLPDFVPQGAAGRASLAAPEGAAFLRT